MPKVGSMSFTLSERERELVDALDKRVTARGWRKVYVDMRHYGTHRLVSVVTKEITTSNRTVALAVADVHEYLDDQVASKLLS